MHSKLLLILCFASLAPFPAWAQIPAAQISSAPAAAPSPQVYTREGVSVELQVKPVTSGTSKPGSLLSDLDATVLFRISSTNGGQPITNLRPTAWIDRREAGKTPDARECREKVQSFLQPSFNKRADIDLNKYFVLALNGEPNISVIDPLAGFGGSKLYTLIPLAAPGADWILSPDRKTLYVSMPSAGQLAAIDTATWKVRTNIDAGAKPSRVALQPDGRYLWVGNDGENDGGVTVIDTATQRFAARFNTGAGHHEIAFTNDDRFAFVSNRQSGTVSIIDIRKLARVKDINAGSLPTSLSFSSLSKTLYVANEGDGDIVGIDGTRLEITSRMKAAAGLTAIRIPADSRFGFAVNRTTSTVHIFDVSTNRLLHAVPVGPAPDQISFTREFAYVHCSESEFVTMIKISGLDKDAQVSVTRFPAGQTAPKGSSSVADQIAPAVEDSAVLVSNASDRMIYYYMEGMAAPMGSFQNYRREPRAVLVFDNGLRETARGVYSTSVRLPRAGSYDVAFLLDSPRLVNCFDITVVENPNQPREKSVAIRIDSLSKLETARAGEKYTLRVKVTDANSTQPKKDLKDLGVLVFLAPGIWQQRELATETGDGVYQISFVPPQQGVYYVFFQSPSLGVRYNQLPPLNIQATK